MGLLYSYVANTRVYHCPTDPTVHVRSYSMQEQLSFYRSGSPYDGEGMMGYTGRLPMYTENQMKEIPPVQTFVFLDESPTSVNDCLYSVLLGGNDWSDEPAIWHSHGDNFSFADGHAEYHKWMSALTLNLPAEDGQPNNVDLKWEQSCVGWQ